MKTEWKRLPSGNDGLTRYQGVNQRAKAWIKRNPDGSAEAKQESGLFGLGTQVTSWMAAPAPSDDVVLSRLDERVNPPRFSGWKEVEKDSDPATTEYRGTANNLLRSPVKARITHKDDCVELSATVGYLGLGTHIEGVYFAPSPSDAEILKRISE